MSVTLMLELHVSYLVHVAFLGSGHRKFCVSSILSMQSSPKSSIQFKLIGTVNGQDQKCFIEMVNEAKN